MTEWSVNMSKVQKFNKVLKFIFGIREMTLILILLVISIIMASISPIFISPLNIRAILMALSVDVPVVVGMAILLISGGLDLSVGSTLAFTGVVTGLSLSAGIPAPISIIFGLLAALGVGLVNGLLVAKVGINPFIATLGMMSVVRGLLLVLSRGRAVLNLPKSFTIIGQGTLFGLQYPIYVMAIIIIIGDILVRNSRFFRQNYYIGSNEKAARLTGINVDQMKIFNFCHTAFLAGISGLLITARFGSASVTVGDGLELKVITAAIIGGASLSGGEGSVSGAFLGALLMAVIANALNLLGVDVFWQTLITGVLLITAVVIDEVNERRKKIRTNSYS